MLLQENSTNIFLLALFPLVKWQFSFRLVFFDKGQQCMKVFLTSYNTDPRFSFNVWNTPTQTQIIRGKNAIMQASSKFAKPFTCAHTLNSIVLNNIPFPLTSFWFRFTNEPQNHQGRSLGSFKFKCRFSGGRILVTLTNPQLNEKNHWRLTLNKKLTFGKAYDNLLLLIFE